VAISAETAHPIRVRRPSAARRWLIAAGVLVLILLIAIVTLPIWIRPFVETAATSALGRSVTIDKLSVSPARYPRITASQIAVASSPDVSDVEHFATIDELAITFDLAPLLHLKMPAIPDISVNGANVTAVETKPGVNNYTFKATSTGNPSKPAALPEIGAIHIRDSHAHVVMSSVAADVNIAIHTEDRTDGNPNGSIVGDVTGTYSHQPITGHLIGGAILNLRDATHPYPIDIRLANGPNKLSLTGTVSDPLKFAGADVKLDIAGQDLAALYPLIGIPVPPTPPYHVTSMVDYAAGSIQLTKIAGRMGNTDLNGELSIDTKPVRPVLDGALSSRKVDLQDLAGFIGSQPGRVNTPGQTQAQRQAVAAAIASPKLIPDMQIDIPKIRSADFHITYRGDSFIGGSVPFDNLALKLDIDDGHIRLTNLRVGVGKGQIAGFVDMAPGSDNVVTKADLEFQRLDVGRLLAAAKVVHGDGVLGGRATLNSTGKSLSEILIRGNGTLSLFMAGGGNISALIIDLSGLQLADATLSALGLPNRQQVRCLIGDLTLAQGSLQTKTLILDTDADRTSGQMSVDLRSEKITARLRTDAKHFTIGSLPTQINISGTLKDPSFAPDPVELGARGAAAVGLGLLFPPAALLPTIQLGTGEDNACTTLAKGAAVQNAKPLPARSKSAKPALR
jgi:uncharacterized protein involved in outer membrane biogenesis